MEFLLYQQKKLKQKNISQGENKKERKQTYYYRRDDNKCKILYNEYGYLVQPEDDTLNKRAKYLFHQMNDGESETDNDSVEGQSNNESECENENCRNDFIEHDDDEKNTVNNLEEKNLYSIADANRKYLRLSKEQSSGKFGLIVGKSSGKLIIVGAKRNHPTRNFTGLNFGDVIKKVDGYSVQDDWTPRTLAGILSKKDSCILEILSMPNVVFRFDLKKLNDEEEIGIVIQNKSIISVGDDSPAKNANLKTEHTIVSINNINVIGMEDNDVKQLIYDSDREVTIQTISTHMFIDVCVGMSEKEIAEYWFDTFAPLC